MQMWDWMGRPADGRTDLGGWTCALCIAGSFCLLNAALYGIIVNLVLYLVDVWGQSSGDAANNVTTLSGTTFLCSFIGAFASDAYFGRLWGSIVFTTLSFIALVLCNVATCFTRSEGGRGWFFAALYLMGGTTGSTVPNLSSLGADQLDTASEKARFFVVCAMAQSVAQVYAATGVAYVEGRGWWRRGYGMCTAAAAAALGLLLGVLKRCRRFKAGGNPLLRVAQVAAACIRRRHVPPPAHPSGLHEVPGKLSAIPGCRKLPHTNSLRFFDKAATMAPHEQAGRVPPGGAWRLCTVTQVEEVKCLLRVIPVGPASMQLFSTAASILTGVCHNAGATRPLFWCINQGRSSRATSLQVQGVSMVVVVLGMVVAALIEYYRLGLLHSGSLMSILWLIPQNFLLGIATTLMVSGSFDFFYAEVSDGMRTISSSIGLLFFGAGSYLSTIIVLVVNLITSHGSDSGWISTSLNDGHLDYFYWFLAGFLLCAFILYNIYAQLYSYRRNFNNMASANGLH